MIERPQRAVREADVEVVVLVGADRHGRQGHALELSRGVRTVRHPRPSDPDAVADRASPETVAETKPPGLLCHTRRPSSSAQETGNRFATTTNSAESTMKVSGAPESLAHQRGRHTPCTRLHGDSTPRRPQRSHSLHHATANFQFRTVCRHRSQMAYTRCPAQRTVAARVPSRSAGRSAHSPDGARTTRTTVPREHGVRSRVARRPGPRRSSPTGAGAPQGAPGG